MRQKTEHDERLAALDKENESFWELMNDLNKADTIQASSLIFYSMQLCLHNIFSLLMLLLKS